MTSRFKKFLEKKKARKEGLVAEGILAESQTEELAENRQEQLENARQRRFDYMREKLDRGEKLDLSGADGIIMQGIMDDLESSKNRKNNNENIFEGMEDITSPEKKQDGDILKAQKIEEMKMNKSEAIEARTKAMDKYYNQILRLKIGHLGKLIETPASVYFGEPKTMEDLLRKESLREIGKIDSPIAGESTEDYLTRLLRESQITPNDIDVLVAKRFNQR